MHPAGEKPFRRQAALLPESTALSTTFESTNAAMHDRELNLHKRSCRRGIAGRLHAVPAAHAHT